jgi:hypothetical protein
MRSIPKTPQRCTSPRRGTPKATRNIYPADPPPKDPDSQTAYQHAAAAISPNAQPHSSEAPLFLIDYTGVPPPNNAQLLQGQHLEKQKKLQRFLDCLKPIWHKDTQLFERQFEEYRDEAH